MRAKRMNIKYSGILVVAMLMISATFLPAIHGSTVNSIIETQLGSLNTKDDEVAQYLQQITDRKGANKKEVFKEVQRYLCLDGDQGSSLFSFLCNGLLKEMGQVGFDEFMSFMLASLTYVNDHDMDVQEANTLIYKRIESIQNDLILAQNDMCSLEEILSDNQDIFNGEDSPETCCIIPGSDFETYWNRYGKAKCYWDGYMPGKTGENEFGPTKLWNVNRRWIGLWVGENFYDWHQNAVDYIIGLDEETGKAPFVQLMNIGISASALFFILSAIIYSTGFFSSNANWILAGGLIALIGLFCASLTAFYLYVVLYYFLYGSNAYFEMQRYGNVDLIVHVINQTGSDISSALDVKAVSADAVYKEDHNEPVYPNFQDVTWSSEEFNYDLVRLNDQHGNREPSTFCLHAAQQSPEKWKQAVPPPGNWVIYIDAEGYITEEKGYPIEDELVFGDCYSITIQLTK